MLKLYHFDRSPFGWKARLVLAEKNVPFEGIVPENKAEDPEFAKLNPWKLTPVLVLEDGRALFESTIICEYLDEKYPDPPMLPKDPVERARVRLIEDTTDQYLYPAVRGVRSALYDWVPPHLVKKPESDVDQAALTTARATLATHLGWLEGQLGKGPWFGGATFSLADAALAPVLASGLTLLGVLPDAAYPGLSSYVGRVKERPSYVASSPAVPLTIKS